MLSRDLSRCLPQAFLEHRQRVEGTDEGGIVCPNVFVENQVEAIPLFAIDKEGIQAKGLLDLQDCNSIMDLSGCGERGGQGSGCESDGGHAYRGAALGG